MAALALVRAIDPDLPFVLVSGAIGEEVAVGAMQAGADDYVMKDKLGRLAARPRPRARGGAARRRHRAAETALVESEARFRALAANLPGVVFQLQFDGDRHPLVYVSDAGAQLFGEPIERLLEGPMGSLDRFAPESRSVAAATARPRAAGALDPTALGRRPAADPGTRRPLGRAGRKSAAPRLRPDPAGTAS